MKRWRDLVSTACGLMAAAFLAAMMLLTVADVTLRAAFNLPLRGVYELIELLLGGLPLRGVWGRDGLDLRHQRFGGGLGLRDARLEGGLRDSADEARGDALDLLLPSADRGTDAPRHLTRTIFGL